MSRLCEGCGQCPMRCICGALEVAKENKAKENMAALKSERDQLRAENERLQSLTTEQAAEIRKLCGLLEIAQCPDSRCDNEGTTVDIEAVCCGRPGGNGDCCGSPEPSPCPAPCQWCHERKEALTKGRGE